MAFLNPVKYKKELQKVLFPANDFIVKAKADDNTGNFKTIQYPNSAEISAAETGSPSLPVAIENTEHSYLEYTTEQIYAKPELIKNEDELLTNYSILSDIRDQQAEVIMRKMHDKAAYNWGPTESSRIRLTTGTDESGGTARERTTTLVSPSAGSRYRIGKLDILWVKTLLSKDNFNVGGQMYGLITPDMYEDLLLIEDFISYDKTGVANKLANGIVGRLMGIEFMLRWNEDLGHAGLHYTQGKSKKTNYKAGGDANNADNDGAAGLFFNSKAVRYSKSPVGTAINRNAPGYLGGTIIEAWTRFGGRISREDQKGVVALVEGDAD